MQLDNVALYGSGLFQDKYPNPTPSYAEQLAQLSTSTFTTIVLWALHVQTNGDFYYNDTPIVQNGRFVTSTDPKKGVNPELPALLAKLKANSSVSTMLFSIGPFQSDFDHIAANMPSALVNFKALMANLPIDGFDFDYEGNYAPGDVVNLVNLTTQLHGLGAAVTYCPYWNQSFWLECLTKSYAACGNTQPVRWYNPQCYDGGSGNNPAEWAQTIAASAAPTGVANPEAFVLPGLWVANTTSKSWMGTCPQGITTQFGQWAQSGTVGGFLWNSSDIFYNETNTTLCTNQSILPSDYAQAIREGLAAARVRT